MTQYIFNCELLSDVIVTSSPATETFPESLDYLPGSKFLGLAAAKLYDEKRPNETCELFHDGLVQFGDAHPLIGETRTQRIPLAWHIPKGESVGPERIIQHHSINSHEELVSQNLQLKQIRSDYFDPISGKFLKKPQCFRLKSAYDTSKRRSEDEMMFGYYSLPAGSIWQFSVSSERADLLEKIKASITGVKRIGRSRSAEYGLSSISFIESRRREQIDLHPGISYLYAESAICLPFDFDGKLERLFPENSVQVLYDKSKIRTRVYKSWNRHRHSLDADRHILEKGSVLALKILKVIQSQYFASGIGERTAEGFGMVICNPQFFQTINNSHIVKLNLEKHEDLQIGKNYFKGNVSKQTALIELLRQRSKYRQDEFSIDMKVNAFISKYGKDRSFSKTTASQWGTVRSYAKLFASNSIQLEAELFSLQGARKGFLVSGIAEEKWRSCQQTLREEVFVQNSHDKAILLQKIASEMAKLKREKYT